MKLKTIFLSLFFAIALISQGLAQNIEKPTINGKTSYAVIVDSTTLAKCRTAIDSYKAVVEGEGLPTYIISKNWSCPEEIKEILKELYKNNNLEGAFFVGDIPYAMVTKAQQMATAFKMDERQYPLVECSVPSDRFYDDFDLEFEFIKDSTDGLKFYYQLSPVSKQYIECDIYSGRILGIESNGDKYEQISNYLNKAVAAHKEHNHFDQFVSFTGHGSHSECTVAWRSEQQILLEQFPGVFTKNNKAKFLRFTMEPYMKESLMRELRRTDLDLFVLHAHGIPERQYLSAVPAQLNLDQEEYIKLYFRNRFRTERKAQIEGAQKLIDKWGLDSTWYADYNTPEMIAKDSLEDLKTGIILEDVNGMAPNSRIVIMDACFNGDYRHQEFIAGKYIMASGQCVVALANSVNVLQDKSAFDYLGLLGVGARVGNWTKHSHILESHVIGDPTFRFSYHHHHHGGEGEHHHSHDINEMLANNSSDFWKNEINNENPDVQNIALTKLVRNNYSGIADILLDKVSNSPLAVVRYHSLMLLESLNAPQWHKALIVASTDNYEFTRRIAIHRMGMVGNPEFIPYLIDTYVNDYSSARVIFNLESSLYCFDKELVLKEIDKYFADKDFYHAEKYKEALVQMADKDYAGKTMADIKNEKGKAIYKIMDLQFLRNRPYHQITDGILEVLQNPSTETSVKLQIVESLGWYRRSVEAKKILATFEKMLAEKRFDTPEMEKELIRACTKLSSDK